MDIIQFAEAKRLLKEHWNYDSFKKGQEDVLESIFDGKNVLAVLPTSYGKSIMFQIPAMMARGGTIIFSPLISLMKDQVDDCKKKGVSANYINSHITEEEANQRLDDFSSGRIKLLYVAPERIKNDSFQKTIRKSSISYIVVDEAHCASQYGHDFRPAYMNIKNIFNLIKTANGIRPLVIAVTATATSNIENDIAESLGIDKNYNKIIADPIRNNINYQVITKNPWGSLRSIISKISKENGRHIVYTSTRTCAEMILNKIVSDYFPKNTYGFYHGGMTKDKREEIQNQFKSGEKTIICATCAFGMGIDIPDIRTIVHFGIPASIEDYVQETGRSGRDGLSSLALLIHDEKGLEVQKYLLNISNPPYHLFKHVWNYLHDKLKPEDILYMPSETMANELSKKIHEEIDGSTFNTVLIVMEKKGLIERQSPKAELIIIPNKEELNNAIENNKLSGNINTVAITIYDYIKKFNIDSSKIIINPEKLCELTDLGIKQVKNALTACAKKNLLKLEPQFRGKSTRILKYNEDLENYITKKEIEDKNKNDIVKLQAMLNYITTNNYKEYIRSYFLGSKIL